MHRHGRAVDGRGVFLRAHAESRPVRGRRRSQVWPEAQPADGRPSKSQEASATAGCSGAVRPGLVHFQRLVHALRRRIHRLCNFTEEQKRSSIVK